MEYYLCLKHCSTLTLFKSDNKQLWVTGWSYVYLPSCSMQLNIIMLFNCLFLPINSWYPTFNAVVCHIPWSNDKTVQYKRSYCSANKCSFISILSLVTVIPCKVLFLGKYKVNTQWAWRYFYGELCHYALSDSVGSGEKYFILFW